jgi:hypothetical protein
MNVALLFAIVDVAVGQTFGGAPTREQLYVHGLVVTMGPSMRAEYEKRRAASGVIVRAIGERGDPYARYLVFDPHDRDVTAVMRRFDASVSFDGDADAQTLDPGFFLVTAR